MQCNEPWNSVMIPTPFLWTSMSPLLNIQTQMRLGLVHFVLAFIFNQCRSPLLGSVFKILLLIRHLK